MSVEAPPVPAPAPVPASTPGPKPVEAAPSSSQYSSIKEALRANAGPEPESRQPERTQERPTPPEKPTPPEVPEKKPETAAKPEDAAAPIKPIDDKATGKFNPIKELKTTREKLKTAEQELARVKQSIVPEQERKNLTQRMEKIQSENEDLRNRIRFKDYENSPDFNEKYHQPYVSKLGDAMELLERIPIVDKVSGQQRAASQQDLFDLMGLNPVEQADRAEELFGSKLAPTVLAMANDVRKALITRNKALEEEKKNGTTREQKEREAVENQDKQIVKAALQLWEEDDKNTLTKDPDLASIVKPIDIPEGKEATPEEAEHNEALKKGFELVDQWWHKRAKDCKTNEEFKDLVRHHAAIRRRAAGFGPLRKKFNRLSNELKKAQSDLKAYQETEPPAGGRPAGNGARQPAGGGNFQTELRQGLRKYAGRGTT